MVVGGRELIDTLWNVNFYVIVLLPYPAGINRYIMECKLYFCNDVTFRSTGINRYIMECKLIYLWLLMIELLLN